MKVTKEQLIEAFNQTVEKGEIGFSDGKESLKLALDDPKMAPQEFENVVGWLTEIFFSGTNLLHINSQTSLTGVLFLNNVTSHSKELILTNSNLHNTSISDKGRCEIIHSKLQESSIASYEGIGSKVIVKYSDVIACHLNGVFIDHAIVVCREILESITLENCHIAHSRLYFGPCEIKNKKFSSVIIDAVKFTGDYFCIGLNGENAVGYVNGTEKLIVVGEKRYNPGSWEEQFVNKEQNLFIKMMNQKKLEMMNMFFDSLAFK